MNCEEFRSQYNVWLDARKTSPLLPEAVLHARDCGACGRYMRVMLRLDAGLQNIPDVPLPEEILAYVEEHGVRDSGREISSLLRKGAVLGLPPVVAWFVSVCLPPPWNFAVQFLLVSGAMVLLAVTSLRPRFIA